MENAGRGTCGTARARRGLTAPSSFAPERETTAETGSSSPGTWHCAASKTTVCCCSAIEAKLSGRRGNQLPRGDRGQQTAIDCAGRDPLILPSSTKQPAHADWIVDALLGTGTAGTIREPYATVIAAINRANKKVLAVDLPSGMDCDTGQPLGDCVRAAHTATFVGRKVGFDSPGAPQFTGEVHVIEIGVPQRLLDEIVLKPDDSEATQYHADQALQHEDSSPNPRTTLPVSPRAAVSKFPNQSC